MVKKLEEIAKQFDPSFGQKQMTKEDVVMPGFGLKESEQQKKEPETVIKIPGISDNKENVKKPLIIDSDKYKPNFSFKELEDNQVQYIFQVDEEPSAKTIDLDISESELRLDSPK